MAGVVVFLAIAGITGGVIWMVLKNNAPKKKKKRPLPDRDFDDDIPAKRSGKTAGSFKASRSRS